MVKLFTHTDLDGVGCAILAKIAFGKELEIEYCEYDNINDKVKNFLPIAHKYERCCITDISVTNDLAKEIAEECNNFVLLDHHPTAIGLNKHFWCHVQPENYLTYEKTSGTELYYQWLIGNQYLKKCDVLDRFVEVVTNYDTWKWSKMGESGVICKQVNDLLCLYGKEHFIRWCLTEINDHVFPRLYASDKFVLDIKQKEIDAYINEKDKQLITHTICNNKICGVVFADSYTSELGNKLCQMHPEIDFVSIIDVGKAKVSYRTIKEDIDLGQIAKMFGGGGHPKASGSSFSKEIQKNLATEIFSQ